MDVYVVKWILTAGVQLDKVTRSASNHFLFNSLRKNMVYCHGEIATSKEAAKEFAKNIKNKKIADLRHEIEKIKSIDTDKMVDEMEELE